VIWNRFAWQRGLLLSQLPSGPKVLGLAMATYADKDGVCSLLVENLAAACSTNSQSIEIWTKVLRQEGWILVQYKKSGNKYLLRMTPTTKGGPL
jgi:hypothetical protein